MLGKRVVIIVLVTVLLGLPLAGAAQAVPPPLPSSFYGTVEIEGASVPTGTIISARIDGVQYAQTTTSDYAGDSIYSIDVPGDDPGTPGIEGGTEGYTITFRIGDLDADQHGIWHGGTNVRLDVTVININDPPVASDDIATTDEDTAVVVDVLDNDEDVDGDALSVSEVSDPADGTVAINVDETVTYTPTADFCGGDSFNYTVSDGVLTDTARVDVTVTCINDPPVAEDDTFTVDDDSSDNVLDVLDNDDDVDGDALSIAIVGTPDEGGEAINGGDVISYTHVAGFLGTEVFTYTVDDGSGGYDTATVTVTVANINDPPTLAGLEDQLLDHTAPLSVTVDLWPYASDPESDADDLTYTIEDPPHPGAGVTIDGDRYLIVHPSPNWCGGADVTIRATDPGGLWDEDTFRLAVSWSCPVTGILPGAPVLIVPIDGNRTASETPIFAWHEVGGAEVYQIQVDHDGDFSSPEMDELTGGTDYTSAAGLSHGTYYWRVRGSNSSEVGDWSEGWAFTVRAPLPEEFTLYLPVVVLGRP